jgi:hypothetical protein
MPPDSTHNLDRWLAAGLRLRQRGHWDRQNDAFRSDIYDHKIAVNHLNSMVQPDNLFGARSLLEHSFQLNGLVIASYVSWNCRLCKFKVLPYFTQLAKVFSQGKYYVRGPRKVQICRNCLLTNTLIKRFCLFIVVINCCLSRNINGTWAPICLFTVMVSTRECLACFFTLQTNTPLSAEMILLVEIQI